MPRRGKTYLGKEVSQLTHEHGHDEHVHEPESGGGLTGYAVAKYGFILIMVIVVLWFVANYFLGAD
jgi:hypothetical protein